MEKYNNLSVSSQTESASDVVAALNNNFLIGGRERSWESGRKVISDLDIRFIFVSIDSFTRENIVLKRLNVKNPRKVAGHIGNGKRGKVDFRE
jgi:hypothetical protein